MKILFIGNVQGLGNIGKYYMTEQRLINGFTRLEHNVYCFNDRDQSRYSNIFRTQKLGLKAMNKTLISSAKSYEPDLLVLGHCKNVKNETLLEIKNAIPWVKIIYTNVDPLSVEQNVSDINQRVGVADSIFITTAGDLLRQFAYTNTAVRYFPNPVDRAIDTQCAYNNPCANIDLLFLGRALRHQNDHRAKLANYLKEKDAGHIKIYIGGLGINDNLHYGAEYYRILNNSKMGICLSKVSNHYLYASDRLSHYLAAGIMTFIPAGSNFEEIIGSDSFVSYECHDDLWEKIIHYSDNDASRIKVATSGYRIAHEEFSADRICQYMLDATFERPFSQAQVWPTSAAIAAVSRLVV